MCRDRFQHIRAALQLHPPSLVTFSTVRDPLYRCRGLLQHFQKRFAETAVPSYQSTLPSQDVHAVQARQIRPAFLLCCRLGFTIRAFNMG
eukprot:jgi/Phyca11/115691/e_gw1.29.185.1